jgi:dTDP-4-dehydrorhamnose reductase
VAPLSVYGRTKAWGEAKVRDANERHFILRTAWVFGTRGANFVRTVVRLAAERDGLEMTGDTRGSPTFSPDLAEAVLLAHAEAGGMSPRWGTYHVAGPEPASRFEMAEAIVAAQAPFTGRRPAVHAVASAAFPAAAPRPRNGVLDSSKFARAFGLRTTPWRRGVEQTVAGICARESTA